MSDNSTPHNSSEYDMKVVKTIPFYKYFHSETIDLVKTIKPDVKSWLDTGCGTGYLIETAISFFSDCIFYLADPSEDMLNECKKRLIRKDFNRIVFLNPVDSEYLAIETKKTLKLLHQYSLIIIWDLVNEKKQYNHVLIYCKIMDYI